MDSPIMFKSSMGGFDKKEVIKYIFELNESSHAAQKRLSEQLEEVTQAREALDHQLAEAEKKLQRIQTEVNSLNAELDGEKTRTGELTEMVERLTADLENYKQLLEAKEQEMRAGGGKMSEESRQKLRALEEQNASQSAELERLRGEIARKEGEARSNSGLHEDYQTKLRELERQQQEVERSTGQVGRLLLEATADADKIRAEAHAEAEQMIFRSRAQAQEMLVKAKDEAGGITAEAERRAAEITETAYRTRDEVQRQFAEFRGEIAAIQDRIYVAAGDMRTKVEQVNDLVGIAGKRLQPEEAAAPTEGKGSEGGELFFR